VEDLVDAFGDAAHLEVPHLIEDGAEEDVRVVRGIVDRLAVLRESDRVALLRVAALEDRLCARKELGADRLRNVAPRVHGDAAELSHAPLLLDRELPHRAEAVDGEALADAAPVELLERAPIDADLTRMDRFGADARHDEVEARALEVRLDLAWIRRSGARAPLARRGDLLETSLEHLSAAVLLEEAFVRDRVLHVRRERRVRVIEHDAREEIDQLEVAKELVRRQVTARERVVAV